MEVRIRFQVIRGAQNVGNPHSRVEGVHACEVRVSLYEDSRVDFWPQARHAQIIPVAHRLAFDTGSRQVNAQHHPMLRTVDARESRIAQIRFGGQTAGELNDLRNGRLTLGLVNRRAAHLSFDTDGRPDRWNEYDIARQQLHIVGRIAADQHVIEVKAPHDRALTFKLNFAQRSNGANATGGKQCRSNRSEAADGVGTWPLRVS